MAMTGVLRPGHISLRVLDLEEGINFYKNTLGLVETGRDDQGRVYFKAWDERDHNSVLIREAEQAGIDFFAFKVADKATLEKLDGDLQAFGLTTERIPAGEMLETGERVRFKIPSGHFIELYAEKTDVGNGQPYVNPNPWIPAAEHGIAPSRMDHCLLYGPDIEKVQEIFEKVLGFFLVEHVLLEDARPTSPSGCRAAPRPTTSRSCATRSPASCTTPPSCSIAGSVCCAPPTSCR
jgi:catechol 2,3-dioxygenase